MEIVVRNISKRTGIELLLKEYGLSASELLAVGDGENDIPMFKLAAHAVAMKMLKRLFKSMRMKLRKLLMMKMGCIFI